MSRKPLGHKAYGNIPHLPGSRRGPGDHKVDQGQARICCDKRRDRHDHIIVQEKLDGSCVAVAKIDGDIVPLGRAGWPWHTAPYEHIRAFGNWALTRRERFDRLLHEGERVVGEWLALAIGTRYKLAHEPFVAFDLMTGHERALHDIFEQRVQAAEFVTPRVIHQGKSISIGAVVRQLQPSGHGAVDPVEGAVWRVERHGKVDFLAKYVRHEKVDGCYLPEASGQPPVWNWAPWPKWDTAGEIERLRKALAPFAKAAKHMTVGKKVEPEHLGVWTACDGSCRLSVADFRKAAEAATKGKRGGES